MNGDSSFMRPIHRAKPGRPPSAGDLEKVQRAVFGARGRNGVRVYVDFDGMVIEGTGASAVSNRPFALSSINHETGTVKVAAGIIIHGTKKISISESVVGVGGGTNDNPSYIAVRYIYGQPAGEILATTVVNFPLPTTTEWKQPIASIYRVNGKIKIKEVLWDSIIILPSVYSPQA